LDIRINNITPSKAAKGYGLKTLTEITNITGTPVRTLWDWHREKPKLFKAVCLGCIAMKEGK